MRAIGSGDLWALIPGREQRLELRPSVVTPCCACRWLTSTAGGWSGLALRIASSWGSQVCGVWVGVMA